MQIWRKLVGERDGNTSAFEVPGGLLIRSYRELLHRGPNGSSESMVFLPGEFHLVKHGSNCHEEWYEIKTGPRPVVETPTVTEVSDDQLEKLADAALDRVKGMLSMNGYRERIRDIVKTFNWT